ncbi:MAG: Melibiase [Lentisphaerae bacterium ADurb.Bin242]|nr:MAG: Melibiase [Lentisphaerae bacterium ADurb.Bin242]
MKTQVFRIENGIVARELEAGHGGIRTISVRNRVTGTEYLREPVNEFMFSANHRHLQSFREGGVRVVDGNREETGRDVGFRSANLLSAGPDEKTLDLALEAENLEIHLLYTVYDGIAGFRKKMTIRNVGGQEIRLESLIFDDTSICPGEWCDCDFYRGQESLPQPLCFTCEGNEDILRCHNPKLNEGWFLGTTVPGVLRFFLFYPHWRNCCVGYNQSSAPFARVLAPGELFETHSSLLALYRAEFGSPEAQRPFRDLIRRQLPRLPDSEGIMYCTWIPFLKDIHTERVRRMAGKAGSFGFQYFVLDDGWFVPPEKDVDRKKFPGGLEEVRDIVEGAGLKLGLWMSIGTDYGLNHIGDKYAARQADGCVKRLGFDYEHSGTVQCFGTEYRDEVFQSLNRLAEEYHVAYFKLDFSSIQSPYGILPFGCHARNHRYHRDFNDSFLAMYEGLMHVRTELKKRHPDLLVDFSFEAFGTEAPNIAALEYSELHHVSNTSAANPSIQSIDRVRKNFYCWLRILPPERILNGLLAIQGDRAVEYLLTSFAGAPLVAGDLDKLDPAAEERIRLCAAAFNRAAGEGAMTEFEVVINEPDIDGFRRSGKDGHGILCLFNRSGREFVLEDSRCAGYVNAETGDRRVTVPPDSCALFIRKGKTVL